MIIEKRDPSLKYTKAIKQEKVRLVLDWLLEFRFSNFECLAKRIGSNKVNSNRFLNSLVSDGLLNQFQNAHTNNEKYVALTSAGLGYLESYGRDVSKAVTRTSTLKKYSQVLHDIAVQISVLDMIEGGGFSEVIWDRNISFDTGGEVPDAVICNEKGIWFAIEVERWRKSSYRIFHKFHSHFKNIKARHYVGVNYIFFEEADLKYYKRLFDEKDWPMFDRKPKSGEMKKLSKIFKPDEVSNLRLCYNFKLQKKITFNV